MTRAQALGQDSHCQWGNESMGKLSLWLAHEDINTDREKQDFQLDCRKKWWPCKEGVAQDEINSLCRIIPKCWTDIKSCTGFIHVTWLKRKKKKGKKRQTIVWNVWNVQCGRRKLAVCETRKKLPGLSRCGSSLHPLQSRLSDWYVYSDVKGSVCICTVYVSCVQSVANTNTVWIV